MCKSLASNYKHIPIEVKCSCGSSDVVIVSGIVYSSYPEWFPFECKKCGREFHSNTYNIEEINDA